MPASCCSRCAKRWSPPATAATATPSAPALADAARGLRAAAAVGREPRRRRRRLPVRRPGLRPAAVRRRQRRRAVPRRRRRRPQSASGEPLPLDHRRPSRLAARAHRQRRVRDRARPRSTGSAWIDAGRVTDPSAVDRRRPTASQFSVQRRRHATYSVLKDGVADGASTNAPFTSRPGDRDRRHGLHRHRHAGHGDASRLRRRRADAERVRHARPRHRRAEDADAQRRRRSRRRCSTACATSTR